MKDPCVVCGGTIFDPGDAQTRVIGRDVYEVHHRCIAQFDKDYAAALQIPMPKVGPPDEDRKGADEQPGWKLARWWNQTYKHRKKQWDQLQVQREFKRIQRKARRGG